MRMLPCAVGSLQMLYALVMHGMMANGVTICSGMLVDADGCSGMSLDAVGCSVSSRCCRMQWYVCIGCRMQWDVCK